MELSITHIREMIWRNEAVTEVKTLCGKLGGSISWEHMEMAWNQEKLIHLHTNSLEICDDCYETFKYQYGPMGYGEE